jgi:Homing endonuclease associated repeat
VTRQEVITAIKRCAEKLGRVPTIFDLVTHEGLARPEIRKHFGSYKLALEECRLEVPRWGQSVEIEQVFNDWMGVARALKRCPTLYEYEARGKYRRRQVRRFFGEYKQVPERMRLYAEKHGLESEWGEVMELLRQPSRGQLGLATAVTATDAANTEANGLVYDPANGLVYHPNESILGSHFGSPGTPVYGPLIHAPGFVYGPTNENGVLCLFGAMAEKLGFKIVRIQVGYPDCEAMRVIKGGRLVPVRIEFEYESRNFYAHMHDPKGCDLIVCWEHNWPECPLPVIELKKAVGSIR